MRNEIMIVTVITALLLLLSPPTGYSYTASDIEQFLEYNRTLNGNPFRLKGGENVDHDFMTDLIQQEIKRFNELTDDYDDPDNPSKGYSWDLKIFHPGPTAGVLPPDGGPYPVMVICKGATGASPELYWYMDWLAAAYARRGYVVAIPQFIEDTSGPPLGFAPFSDIRVDIYALQVSQTLDYLEDKFQTPGLLNSGETTVVGHSFGGYVSLDTACRDRRIARIALLSAYYENYYEATVVDTYDLIRILNALSEKERPALHVQRFTLDNAGCPAVDPVCDPVPVVDGFVMNLAEDPWLPYTGYCDGSAYDCSRGGSFYHYTLYEGPKEDGIRTNPYLDHSGGDVERGRPEVIRLLDNFFETFPVTAGEGSSDYALVETRSTPGFSPPVFLLETGSLSCPVTYLLGEGGPQVVTLRNFRDRVLTGSRPGRFLVERYYFLADGMVTLLDRYPPLRTLVKGVLDLIVPPRREPRGRPTISP